MNTTPAPGSHPSETDGSWVLSYLGKPYVRGGRGPSSFDCWGLVWAVLTDVFKLEIDPMLGVVADTIAENARTVEEMSALPVWRKLSAPQHLCVVTMSQNSAVHHVGVWLACDGGVVLHAVPGVGVVVQSVRALSSHGWRIINAYKHKDQP